MSESENDCALVKYADGLLAELREDVHGALRDFDADAIHDARVATRRLSAVLDLLEPVLSTGPRKKFGRILKKLRRRLCPLRDLDVMLDHLHDLADTPSAASGQATASPPSQPEAEAPVPPPPSCTRPHAQAVAWMIDRLEAERAESRKKSAGKKSIPRIMESLATWWELHDELADAEEASATLLADSIHLQLDAFAEQAAFHTTISHPFSHPFSHPAPAAPHPAPAASDPHALRKAGKALRYTLELADKIGRPLPPGTIGAFKKLQDALGIWHDYAVLAKTVLQASVDESLAYHNPDLQLRLLELARFAIKRSARALTRFARLWRRRGEPLTQSIRQAFPLTKDPTAGKDVSESAEPAANEPPTSPPIATGTPQ